MTKPKNLEPTCTPKQILAIKDFSKAFRISTHAVIAAFVIAEERSDEHEYDQHGENTMHAIEQVRKIVKPLERDFKPIFSEGIKRAMPRKKLVAPKGAARLKADVDDQ
jgi:hypothetical protein